MLLSLINPYIRLATPSVIPSGNNISRRIIYDYELISLERGEFTLIYNDIPYHCEKGDIIFICPGIPHSFIIENGEISQPHIHFDITHRPHSDIIPISFKDFDRMSEKERSYIHKNYFSSYKVFPLVKIQDQGEFSNIFHQIISEETDALEKKAKLMQLLSMLIKDNFPTILETQEYLDTAQQLKDYIDSGNGLKLSLNDFEKIFFQSKFCLEKNFKEAFGMSIIRYRNKKRMELAPSLLKNGSVTETADVLGYQSIFSFSRAYKQYYGYSPHNHILG